MPSLHCVCMGTEGRNMHVNIIKGAPWFETEKKVCLFYVFDLEVRHMRTPTLISNCGFLKCTWFSLFSRGRKSHLHSCQTCQERFSRSHQNLARQHRQINERQGRERCLLNLTLTVYSTVKLITLNDYMKVKLWSS